MGICGLASADGVGFFLQVDEEAALEQAVKFCQVHVGASAQKQVSSELARLLSTTRCVASSGLREKEAEGPPPALGPFALLFVIHIAFFNFYFVFRFSIVQIVIIKYASVWN